MTSINTSLMNILQSELINRGHNEFFNNNQVTMFDDEFTFIQKIMNYDKDIEEIVNDKFFKGLKLSNDENDRKFKRTWINKFLKNRPSFQTLESFASEVCYVFLINEDFLNEYYENIEEYVSGTQQNNGNSNRISDTRQANATLPQLQVNIDVDDTILPFADDNFIHRTKEDNTKDDTNKNYNIDNLKKLESFLKSVFDEFDKCCFLQIW